MGFSTWTVQSRCSFNCTSTFLQQRCNAVAGTLCPPSGFVASSKGSFVFSRAWSAGFLCKRTTESAQCASRLTVRCQGDTGASQVPDKPRRIRPSRPRSKKVRKADSDALRTFAAHIAAADTASGVIEIPREYRRGVLPPRLSQSVYIRDSYLEVLRKLDALGDDFALVLSGSPGIGKSAFAVLLLHHLAKQRAKVAYRYVNEEKGDTIVYFDYSELPKIHVEVASQGNAQWEPLLDRSVDPDVWRIRDGAAPPTQYGGRGRVVILCSPNVDNYKEFAKGEGCKVWWLPVWSHSEFEECRRRLYPKVDKEMMEKRILEFGGLIRFVLADPDSSFEDLASTLPAEQAIALYHLSLASVESDLRHVFAHIAVNKLFDLENPATDWQTFYIGSWRAA